MHGGWRVIAQEIIAAPKNDLKHSFNLASTVFGPLAELCVDHATWQLLFYTITLLTLESPTFTTLTEVT